MTKKPQFGKGSAEFFHVQFQKPKVETENLQGSNKWIISLENGGSNFISNFRFYFKYEWQFLWGFFWGILHFCKTKIGEFCSRFFSFWPWSFLKPPEAKLWASVTSLRSQILAEVSRNLYISAVTFGHSLHP